MDHTQTDRGSVTSSKTRYVDLTRHQKAAFTEAFYTHTDPDFEHVDRLYAEGGFSWGTPWEMSCGETLLSGDIDEAARLYYLEHKVQIDELTSDFAIWAEAVR